MRPAFSNQPSSNFLGRFRNKSVFVSIELDLTCKVGHDLKVRRIITCVGEVVTCDLEHILLSCYSAFCIRNDCCYVVAMIWNEKYC